MDRKSMQDLRLDRRLIRRRSWISKEDLQRELEALHDVSGKAEVLEGGAERAADGDEDPRES